MSTSRAEQRGPSVASTRPGPLRKVAETAGAGNVSMPQQGTYYVAPDGDDHGPGTKSRPFATTEAAVREIESGESIVLRGGEYRPDSSIKITGPKGSPGEQMKLVGHPGEHPVLRFDGPTPGGWNYSGRDGGGLTFENVEYWYVSNLTVRNSQYYGINVTAGSKHNTFENVTTHTNNLVGFGITGRSTHNFLRNIVSRNNYDIQNGGSDADGIQIRNSHNNVVRGARLTHNSDDGLDLWESHSNVVEGCISWGNGRGESGDGNGFKLGGGSIKSGGHEIMRNVAFDNLATGFDFNDSSIGIKVYNNTAWKNGEDYVFFNPGHELVNNIAFEGNVTLGSEVVSHTNSWNVDIENPGFVSTDPKDDSFLHLMDGSPCIDQGTKVGVKYYGDVPDLGAYEYHGLES